MAELIKQDGVPVSVASAVIEDGCMAMLNVYTDKNHRLKGYARKACENLLNEAVKFGAHTAYLQVVADNGPAYHIYDSLGYKKIYTYRYREK